MSVLTTGFDAPHVDLIAILRPTESVGLYQQIVGRGLHSDAEPVQVECPGCGHANLFWEEVVDERRRLRAPDFVIGRKVGRHWQLREKVLDYLGRYRKADAAE